MKFIIAATKPILDENELEVVGVDRVQYFYDNMTSELWDSKGNQVDITPMKNLYNFREFPATSVNTPVGKSALVKTLKIQLGLSCNYSCEYCSQRFVPNIEHSNTKLLDKFVASLDNWLKQPPEEIEFWGGEPFVYWKNFKPLAEALRTRFPYAKFLVITNGSLLTDEIIDWLDRLEFNVGVSHDGPGQNVRGPNPFEDPVTRELIIKLFERLLPKKKISINSMIHRENLDRAAIQSYFDSIFGKERLFAIGEGSFVDVYDEGGMKNTLQSHAEHLAFRRMSLESLDAGTCNRFLITYNRMEDWINSWGNKRPAYAIGQKCGMDDPYTVAVDLMGNVLTCQNVTVNARAPNGKSHRIGHVDKFDEIKLNTATHWKYRDECSKCPMLQVCKGSCMFLEGEYFQKSCDTAYSDHLPFFAKAFELMTGALPYAIQAIEDDYKLPTERSNLWGGMSDEVYAPPTRQEPFLG
jgi:uncharacterized protein